MILGTVFLAPWRIEDTGEIAWAPLYRQPAQYSRTYDGGGGVRISEVESALALDVMILQVIAIGVVGGGVYVMLPKE